MRIAKQDRKARGQMKCHSASRAPRKMAFDLRRPRGRPPRLFGDGRQNDRLFDDGKIGLTRRMHQKAAQARQGRAHLAARHDHVDHAVLFQIFGLLEAVRELLADGLLDDARPGEADERLDRKSVV